MAHTRPLKTTSLDILRENALQIVLYILGAVLAGLAWWPLALIYLAYCVLSNVLYMAWVCPYCGHYRLATCPAGFDILSGRRFKMQPGKTFGTEFRRNVYVMVPGWFLPPLAGLYLPFFTGFSWAVLGLVIAFSVIGFWWLPETSKKHCEGCETVDCPRRPKRQMG
jgi:hypothetical protein